MFSIIPQGPFHSFLWLSNILLYTYKYKIFILYKHIYKTSPLSIHQLIDICFHILVLCVCVQLCLTLCDPVASVVSDFVRPYSPLASLSMGFSR